MPWFPLAELPACHQGQLRPSPGARWQLAVTAAQLKQNKGQGCSWCVLAPFHQLHKAGASFQLRASRRAGQQAAGSSQHTLGDPGEVKAETASQSPGCSLATYLCAIIYCPSMPEVQVELWFTWRNTTSPSHCRCRGVPCIPIFASVQLRLSCPDCSLGITSSQICSSVSPFTPVLSSTPLDCSGSDKRLWKETENLRRGNQCPPGSFHAGNPQWSPPPQAPAHEFIRGHHHQAFSPAPCSSHGMGLYIMWCFSCW